MKKSFYSFWLFVLIGLTTLSVQGQITANDPILGIWFNEEKDGKVALKIDENGKLYGTIIWLLNPNNEKGQPKLDVHNKNVDLRSRPILGLNPVWGFDKEDDAYVNGKIYDPKSGKTYSCKIRFDTENKHMLRIRGYIGVPALGKTTFWTRTTE